MPQLALAVVGAEIGGLFGAQAIGWAAGSLIGGALFTPKTNSQGPRLSDLKAAAIAYGAGIPFVEGEPRLGGNIIWQSAKMQHATTTSYGGKSGGGAEQTTYTYTVDILYMLSANVCWNGITRVWQNGELIGAASAMWDEMIFYDGNAAQMPDPTYEAAVGSANAEAYRGRATVMIRGLKLGSNGELPNLTFQGTPGTPTYYLGVDWGPGLYFRMMAGRTFYVTRVRYVPGSVTFPGVNGDPAYAQFDIWQSAISLVNGELSFSAEVDIGNVSLATPPHSYTVETWHTSGGGRTPSQIQAALEAGLYDRFPDVVYSDFFTAWQWLSPDIYVGSSFGPIDPAAPPGYISLLLPFTQTVGDPAYSVTDGGLNSEIISARTVTGYLARIDDLPTTLQSVVERQCLLAGYTIGQIDASALSGLTVRAMAITQAASPRQVIEMLMTAYRFTAVDSGDVLRFVLRGGASVVTIPYDDLIANGDSEPLPIKRANDIELPSQYVVKYSNVLDDMNDATETSDRLVSDGQSVTQIELPLGLTPSEAKAIADFLVIDAIASNTHFGPFGLMRDYAYLEPTDVVTLTDSDGNQFRVRLTKKTESGGELTFEGVSDDGNVVLNTATGTTSTAGYVSSTVVRQPVDTVFTLLDIPILRDADDDAGLYAGAKAATNVTFPGAALFKANDNVTFAQLATLQYPTVYGVTQSVLGSGVIGVFDEKNSVTVYVPYGQLASYTRDVILNTASGLYLIGDEIVQARNATLIAANTYQLSGLLRGLRGTEWAVGTHFSGERCVLLDTAIRRVTLSTADIGTTEWWKAVTLGRSLDTASSSSFSNTAVGKKPFAPVDLRVARDASNNITITLQRRSRYAGQLIGPSGIVCPLAEESESYSIDIYATSGYATVKRTIAATSASISYAASDQTTDFGSAQSTIYFKAYQLSATVGRGNAATARG